MGVPGLWDIIADAGESRSLGHLAVVDGFEKNPSGRRALRVGIDVSLWFHQITRKYAGLNSSELGDNPQLRALFFRLCSIAEWPILPLFVFDGRKRPKVKRGSKMGKSGSYPLSQPMKDMLGHFGMQWCEATGEAEAELACLNQDGLIDAIITDDCDALIFGGKTIIRNASLDLSGNKANPALDANGNASKHHVMVYTADAVRRAGLSRGALLLFALLAGGDYHSGVPNVGKVTASGLARCGFGDRLLEAFEHKNEQQLKTFLVGWRAEMNAELRSNSRGYLKQRNTSLTIPPDFPDFEVLANYAAPVRDKSSGGRAIRDNRDINLPALAEFCEDKFSEWGHRSAIIKRFRTLLWQPAVMHVLRRAALMADEKERENLIQAGVEDPAINAPLQPLPSESVGTPASLVRRSLGFTDPNARFAAAFVNKGTQDEAVPDTHPLLMKIVNTRNHVSTDEFLEFRAEVCPHQLVALADSGIKGTRKAPPKRDGVSDQKSKTPPEPESNMRMWIPATMLQQVHPALIYDYFDNTARGKGKGKALAALDDESDSSTATPPVAKRR
ncbi:PIN domain-like protein [Mycena latifolia]|nr:PIN domain-like protein [Mycena latifolia]